METYEMIKKLRKAANLSQDELARKVGYSDRSSIAKIETGKVDLPETKIKLFAQVLNTTPAELMGIKEFVSAEKEDDSIKKPTARIHSELSESDRVILDLIQSIPSGKKMEAIRYLRYLAESEDSE